MSGKILEMNKLYKINDIDGTCNGIIGTLISYDCIENRATITTNTNIEITVKSELLKKIED